MSDYRTAAEVVRSVFVGTNGFVLCLDADTGVERWRHDIGDTGRMSAALVLVGDFLFVAYQHRCARIAVRDGSIAWRTDHEKIPTPNVMTVELDVPRGRVVIAGAGEVAALAADTGEVIWFNGLEGLGYNPVVMRVPGSVGTHSILYRVGKSSHTTDDGQSSD